MRNFKFLGLLLLLCMTVFLTESCKLIEEPVEPVDPCATVSCENGGTCDLGICACPLGYIGDSCEQIDTSQVQALLDSGVTPKSLYDSGVSLEQLYGKNYADGLIFYLNTTDGTGLVAAMEDQNETAQWGCQGFDIPDLNNVFSDPVNPEVEIGAQIGDGAANTDLIIAGCEAEGRAAALCRAEGAVWFLPSRGELNLMYRNLHLNGHGGFATDWYWSSSENDGNFAWVQYFDTGSQANDVKNDYEYVRAARAF